MFQIAAARGITLFDTAGLYGGGTSEQLVGEHARASSGVFVMTKIGRQQTTAGLFAHSLKHRAKPMLGNRTRGMIGAMRRGAVRLDFSPRSLRLAMLAAKARLGEAPMGALLLHSPPAQVVVDHATMAVLTEFKTCGYVETVGVSCDDIDTLRAAVATQALDILQIPLSLYRSALAEGIVDRIAENDLALVVRGVLGERGGMSVREAVTAACGLFGVSSVIVGVSSPMHLLDLFGHR